MARYTEHQFRNKTIANKLKDTTEYTKKITTLSGHIIYPNQAIFKNGSWHYLQTKNYKPSKYSYVEINKSLYHTATVFFCPIHKKYYNTIQSLVTLDGIEVIGDPTLMYLIFTNNVLSASYEKPDLTLYKLVRNTIYIKRNSENKIMDISSADMPIHADKHNIVFNLLQEYYKDYVIPKNIPILHKLGNLFKDFSFGCEFELSKFKLHYYDATKAFLVPLRDSSIQSMGNGIELATIPLQGVKGFHAYHNALEVIKTGRANISCAFHVHIGYPYSREELIALYTTYFRVQDEIQNMLPYYLRDPVGIGKKRKNYSEPLLNILPKLEKSIYTMTKTEYRTYVNSSISRLFKLFRGTNYDKKNNKEVFKSTGITPWKDTWRNATRYANLNLYHYFVSNSTVEFRAHQGTSSYIRAMNMTLIYLAITKYAIDNTTKILNLSFNRDKLTLYDVIYDVFSTIPNMAKYLIDYIVSEKELREEELITSVLHANNQGTGTDGRNYELYNIANNLIEDDKNFKFKHKLDPWENIMHKIVSVPMEPNLDLN